MTPIERKARELLAAEYEASCLPEIAGDLRAGVELGGLPGASLRATITALTPPAGGLPEGWVAVPREPTDEMIEAGAIVTNHVTRAIQVYVDMLAAAPQVALNRGGEEGK